jgi:hypothetical protein
MHYTVTSMRRTVTSTHHTATSMRHTLTVTSTHHTVTSMRHTLTVTSMRHTVTVTSTHHTVTSMRHTLTVTSMRHTVLFVGHLISLNVCVATAFSDPIPFVCRRGCLSRFVAVFKCGFWLVQVLDQPQSGFTNDLCV